MNPSAKPTFRIVLFYLICAILIACVGAATFVRIKYSQPPLAKIKPLPEFKLIERSGRDVTLADFKGKILLVDFIYSECPGPCPMISSRFSELQSAALQNPDVLMVSITLNPERDTSEVLKKYADRFHASPDRWLFLTGEKSKVRDLVVNGFMMTVLDQADKTQPIIHSTKIALVDKHGTIRAYFDSENENNQQEILSAVRRLGNE